MSKKVKNKSIVENIPKKRTKIELKLHKHKIPAIVTDISHLGKNHIKIKIMGNPKIDSIVQYEVYDIHLKHVEIAKIESWEAIINE